SSTASTAGASPQVSRWCRTRSHCWFRLHTNSSRMENLTHTLVGLMLARVGLEKTTPRGAGMLMLAANVPDIDGVYWFGGALPYIEHHRTYTHSLTFLPLMALLPMLLVRATFSWRAYLASMAAVLSHLLLDCTNFYGVPLALPFSS